MIDLEVPAAACRRLGRGLRRWRFMLALPLLAVAVPAAAIADDMIGQIRIMRTAYEDTLLDVARNNGLGLIELMAANPGVDEWVPGEGTKVVLPTAHILPDAPHRGIVINLAELRLYYFPPDGSTPQSFPIGVGRDGFKTPQGQTKIVRKKKGPAWYPTANTRADRPDLPSVVPAGPDNPLGDYALYLGWPAYLIHGTNMPYGVGRRVSRGCIRLYPENIEYLFGKIPTGTPVTVVNQSVMLGWHDGNLYIEVHPSPEQVDQIEEEGVADPVPVREQSDPDRILQAAGDQIERIDWDAVNEALAKRQGIPVRITRGPGISDAAPAPKNAAAIPLTPQAGAAEGIGMADQPPPRPDVESFTVPGSAIGNY